MDSPSSGERTGRMPKPGSCMWAAADVVLGLRDQLGAPAGVPPRTQQASRTRLESATGEGESPVGEGDGSGERRSQVRRRPWKAVGSRGDHSPRQHTRIDR